VLTRSYVACLPYPVVRCYRASPFIYFLRHKVNGFSECEPGHIVLPVLRRRSLSGSSAWLSCGGLVCRFAQRFAPHSPACCVCRLTPCSSYAQHAHVRRNRRARTQVRTAVSNTLRLVAARATASWAASICTPPRLRR